MRRSSSTSDCRISLIPTRVARPSIRTPLRSTFDIFPTSRTFSAGGRSTSLARIGSVAAPKRGSHGFDRSGRSDVFKDPRPVGDRLFTQKNIKTLMEFLGSNGYPYVISSKILQSPPLKEFLKIFEFLFQHFEPKYKVDKKYEEEIPKILRHMGYPFMLSKSSMFAVGSPHTWPSVLAALVWLVDIIKSSPADSRMMSIIFQLDFDGAGDEQLVFQYLVDTYESYFAGQDTFETHDEHLSKVFKNKYYGSSGEVSKLESENIKLTEELKLYEEESDLLKDLQDEKEVIDIDQQKFLVYLEDLKAYRLNQIKLLEREMEEQSLLGAEWESLATSIQKMQVIFDSQEFTPADVEQIKVSRQELQRQLSELEKDIENVGLENWAEEMNIAKLQDKNEAGCQTHNKLARVLKLIPATAENANGKDFELQPNYHTASMENDYLKSIKPLLHELKNRYSEVMHQTNCRKRQLKSEVEMETDRTNELNEETKQLKNSVKQIETELECKKEVYQKNRESKQSQYESKCAETNMNRKKLQLTSQELEDLHTDLNQTKEWSIKEFSKMASKVNSHEIFLKKVVSRVIDHKTKISNRLTATLQKLKEQRKEEEKDIYIPE